MAKHIQALHVDMNLSTHQPFIVSLVLHMLPSATSCGVPDEPRIHAAFCPVLKLLPISTAVANSWNTPDGHRSIRVNRWGDWGAILRQTDVAGIPPRDVLSWTIWHELGHFYEMDRITATSPWYDEDKTHHSLLYRETHADIFALINIAQDPKVSRAAFVTLTKGVIALRKKYAEDDTIHAGDEYLTCLTLNDYLTRENAVTASQRLLETALVRKASGKCFNVTSKKAAKS